MEKSKFIWMDGEFIPWDEAKIHILTHSLHYGSGIFDGMRFYKTHDDRIAIFRLKEHIERFYYSAKVLELDIKYKKEEFEAIILDLIKKNEFAKSGYIRPLGFYGVKMGLNPAGAPSRVALAAWSWESYLGEDAVKVKTSSIMRIHPKTTDIAAKISGIYANSIIASLEARREGFHEALLLDYEGNVSEGPGENVYYVKDGVIYTPESGNILKGITRDSILQIAKDEEIEVVEKKCTLKDFKSADESFFSGTAAEITAINQIDDSIINDGKIGPITTKLKEIFTDITLGKISKYFNWLTYVQ